MAKQQHLLKLGSLIPENADTGPEWSVEQVARLHAAQHGAAAASSVQFSVLGNQEERRGGEEGSDQCTVAMETSEILH